MYIESLIQNIKENNNGKMGHNHGSSYNYDHMVYIRLFEGCNLNCEHCFIPSNPKKINPEFYDNNGITELLLKHGKVKENDILYLQWHGGEPTLLGAEYLGDAVEKVVSDKRFKYINGIQTNLINFDKDTDKWVSLYKRHFDSMIGVSWDYGIRHTKSTTLDLSITNKNFEDKFWSNVELAQKHGLELYMVITATKMFFNHFKDPFDFFDFIVEKGITKLNLERITKTGYARESWEKLGLSNKEYSTYMAKFFKAYCLFKENNPDIALNISPFDGLLESSIGLILNNTKEATLSDKANIWDILSYKNQGYGCWSGVCDTRFHTIDSSGYKHGCTALTSEQDNKNKTLQNNLEVKKVIWFNKKEDPVSQRNVIVEQRKKRQETCVDCEFIKICSSGCLSVEKFDESEECSGGKILFTTIKRYLNNVMQ